MSGFGIYFKEKTVWLSHNRIALAAVAIIGLLPFLTFFFTGGGALYASDAVGSPAWKFYLDSIRDGVIPQWSPYGLGGMPTFDVGFGDGAYPVFLLIGIIMPIKTFISYCFILHVVIAGLAAYYLVNRFFGLGRMLSTALAVAYMLNTNFISHIHAGHTGKFYHMAWLPLSMYLLLRSLSRNGKWYHTGLFALSITLLMSTFHPQFTYYVLMGYFLVWGFKLFWRIRENGASAAAMLGVKFWLPILCGIGLVFFLFYPPLQWTKTYGIRGSSEKTTYEHATSWSMHPEETASLVVPEFGGINEKYWGRNPFKLNSESPGLSILFLGILGFAFFHREKRKWFWLWGGVGLLAVIFGLGAHTPLFRLFYAFIPGIKNFRAPSMMLFWLAMALLIMSADLLSRLTGPKAIAADRKRVWGKRLFQAGFGISGLLILMGLSPGIFLGMWDAVFGGEAISNLANRAAGISAMSLGALRAGVLLAALIFATRKWLLDSVEPARFGVLLLAVTCLDLMWVNSNFIKVYDPDRMLPDQPAIQALKSDTSEYRVFGLPGTYERWVMQYNHIETADGWTDNEYRLYREYRGGDYMNNPNLMANLKQNPDGSVSGSRFLDMLNVKYLAYRLQGEGAMRLAANTSVMPRAWFVDAWRTESDTVALESMKRSDFDPRRMAYISSATALPSGFAAAASAPDSAQAAIRQVSKSYNRHVYRVENDRPGILVLSELWFPHWHLKVDGKDAALLRANFAFRGVALSSGSHEVEFSYGSPWAAKGFAVAGLSLAILAAGLFAIARFAPAAEAKG